LELFESLKGVVADPSVSKKLSQYLGCLWALCHGNGLHIEAVVKSDVFFEKWSNIISDCTTVNDRQLLASLCLGVGAMVFVKNSKQRRKLFLVKAPAKIASLLKQYPENVTILIQSLVLLNDLNQEIALRQQTQEVLGALEIALRSWKTFHKNHEGVTYTVVEKLSSFVKYSAEILVQWGVPELVSEILKCHPDSSVVQIQGEICLESMYKSRHRRGSRTSMPHLHSRLVKVLTLKKIIALCCGTNCVFNSLTSLSACMKGNGGVACKTRIPSTDRVCLQLHFGIKISLFSSLCGVAYSVFVFSFFCSKSIGEIIVDVTTYNPLKRGTDGKVAACINTGPNQENFHPGQKIEARYGGKRTYYPGQIKSVGTDGSCDILYDDGEEEANVNQSLIRVLIAHDDGDWSAFEKSESYSFSGEELKQFGSNGSKVPFCHPCEMHTTFSRFQKGARIVLFHENQWTSMVVEHIESQWYETRKLEFMKVGDHKEKWCLKQRYYRGKITRKRLNGTFDILYDDGEKEMGVDKSLIKSFREGSKVEFWEGSKVEAQYRNFIFKPGKISRKLRNGTFNISYDDGEKEFGVHGSLIRSYDEEFGKGSKVEVRHRGGAQYFNGKITRTRLNGTFDILYDDGEKEMGVDKSRINSLDVGEEMGVEKDLITLNIEKEKMVASGRFTVGQKIEARRGEKKQFLPGLIEGIDMDGACEILYDDGEKESNVSPSLLRELDFTVGQAIEAWRGQRPIAACPASSGIHFVVGQKVEARSRKMITEVAEELGEGSKVEVRYRGGSNYYKGKITRKRRNGTFDILYDDGEEELGVEASLIRSSFYHPGHIESVGSGGACNILYEDGEAEANVEPTRIRGRWEHDSNCEYEYNTQVFGYAFRSENSVIKMTFDDVATMCNADQIRPLVSVDASLPSTWCNDQWEKTSNLPLDFCDKTTDSLLSFVNKVKESSAHVMVS
jgi:hypothetical protein